MGKNRGGSAVAEPQTETPATEASATTATPVANFTLTYRRDHPKDRASYGVAGNSGIVVFDKSLFADGTSPASIVMDAALVAPKADNKTAKAEAQAAKLIDKAAKAQAKIEAAQAKAAEKAAKAQEMLDKAKAKIAAAQAPAPAGDAPAQ